MSLRTAILPSLVVLILFPACVSLKREPPRKRMFGLETVRPSQGRLSAGTVVLLIRTAHVAAPYDSNGFVYRQADGTWESDFHNEFFAPPAGLITEQVRRWLVGTPGCPRVVEAGTREKLTHILHIRVNALFGDYSDRQARRAVLEMEFAIDAVNRTAEMVVFERAYRREVPFEEPGPDGLIGGWNRSLEEILTELVADLGAAEWSAADR